jgi:hypothetical protein
MKQQIFEKWVKLMKAKSKNIYAVAVAVISMVACGGSGDDNAGQSSEFQVSPAEKTLNSGNVNCPGPGKAGDFLVIGGAAPYTAFSSSSLITFGPAGGTVATTAGSYEISNRNSQFAIFVSNCMSPGIVTVLDKLNRVATISVTAASGSGS